MQLTDSLVASLLQVITHSSFLISVEGNETRAERVMRARRRHKSVNNDPRFCPEIGDEDSLTKHSSHTFTFTHPENSHSPKFHITDLKSTTVNWCCEHNKLAAAIRHSGAGSKMLISACTNIIRPVCLLIEN